MGDHQKITPWIINHWLEHVRNGIIHIKHVDKPSMFLWIGFMDPLSAQKYNAGGDRSKIKEKNPIDYFQSIIKRISGERNKDSLKYEEILKDKTEEDYIYVFQQLIYIALRLTEQLDSTNSPWEVDLEKFPTIDFKKVISLDEVEDKQDYDEILKEIISDAACGSPLSSKLNK